MKTFIALALTILFKIAMSVSCIWALVEFILYLVNKNPFDWWSVGCIGASFVLMFISWLFAVIMMAKKEDEDWRPKPRSSFQDKLKKMAEEREKYN